MGKQKPSGASDAAMQNEIFVILTMIVLVFSVGVLILSMQAQDCPDPQPGIQKNHGLHPPIYELSGGDYQFDSGSSELTDEFLGRLQDHAIPWIAERANDCSCEVLEVIGFTDGQPFIEKARKQDSDLDQNLLRKLEGLHTAQLLPTSNVELGMTRAISVALHLNQALQKDELGPVRYIRPYSAGQATDDEGRPALSEATAADDSRRRIVIRLIPTD